MKKTSYFKKLMHHLTLVAFIIFFASCGYNQRTADSKDVAEDQNETRIENNEQEKDAQFLVNAAEINLEEIRLGQLAQQKGNTTHVKELGKMMEDAHTKSLNDLTTLAKNKMIAIPTLPTDDTKDTYRSLNEKTGDDFDKEYTDIMVSEHQDAIDAFEKASAESNDVDIKNWATISLPGLRTHLNHSLDSQNKLDKN